ncbi:hypothetical protein MVES_003469 [Malassezia vespertilionis]|uniref:Dog2p n=1 Tax=Malassezia vespertilionis TaxID=2020962 RepID=A0A2N1J7Y3_9BASI|nr:hypothetical protein MVES_003469 [Malassezia vespertilionis]
MPVFNVTADGILFDMDGTLISSTAALSAVWVEFAKQYDMDLNDLRTNENLRERLPQLTDKQCDDEAVRFENRIIEISDEKRAKLTTAPDAKDPQGTIVGLPGVRSLLSQLNQHKRPNRDSWAIVTSATGDYARQAFLSTKSAGLPAVFISSDEVNNGKPDPEPYLKGAQLSHFDIKDTIVFEDAPAGVLSGKRAGARVLAVTTTHDAQRLWDNGADWVVDTLDKVSAHWEGDVLHLTIDSNEKPQ